MASSDGLRHWRSFELMWSVKPVHRRCTLGLNYAVVLKTLGQLFISLTFYITVSSLISCETIVLRLFDGIDDKFLQVGLNRVGYVNLCLTEFVTKGTLNLSDFRCKNRTHVQCPFMYFFGSDSTMDSISFFGCEILRQGDRPTHKEWIYDPKCVYRRGAPERDLRALAALLKGKNSFGLKRHGSANNSCQSAGGRRHQSPPPTVAVSCGACHPFRGCHAPPITQGRTAIHQSETLVRQCVREPSVFSTTGHSRFAAQSRASTSHSITARAPSTPGCWTPTRRRVLFPSVHLALECSKGRGRVRSIERRENCSKTRRILSTFSFQFFTHLFIFGRVFRITRREKKLFELSDGVCVPRLIHHTSQGTPVVALPFLPSPSSGDVPKGYGVSPRNPLHSNVLLKYGAIRYCWRTSVELQPFVVVVISVIVSICGVNSWRLLSLCGHRWFYGQKHGCVGSSLVNVHFVRLDLERCGFLEWFWRF